MHFEGSQKLDHDIKSVWALLNDPGVLARATPGVKELKPIEQDKYDAVFHIKMGPINSMFTGKLHVEEKQLLNSYKLVVDVNARIGIIKAEVTISLVPDEKGTMVSFIGDGALSGKLAAMGQRVLSGVARMFTKRFFKQLAKETPSEAALVDLDVHSGG